MFLVSSYPCTSLIRRRTPPGSYSTGAPGSQENAPPPGPYRRPLTLGSRGVVGGWTFSRGRGTPVGLSISTVALGGGREEAPFEDYAQGPMFVLGGGTISYERGTPLERLIQDPVLAPPCRDWRQDGVPRRGHFHDAVLTSSSCWEAAHFASKKRLLPGSGSACAVGMPPDSSQSLSEAVAREASSPPRNHDRLPGQMGPPQDRWARLKIDGPASGQMGPPRDRWARLRTDSDLALRLVCLLLGAF